MASNHDDFLTYNIIILYYVTVLNHVIIIIIGVDTFTIYDARLGSGSATSSGRVEVLTSLGWLPVCDIDSRTWDPQESEVLCHQLGYRNYSSYSESCI